MADHELIFLNGVKQRRRASEKQNMLPREDESIN